MDKGDGDDDDAEEKSLGIGTDIGSGRLIMELLDMDDDPAVDEDEEGCAGGGGGGPCKDAAQATTELIDWLASTICRFNLQSEKKVSSCSPLCEIMDTYLLRRFWISRSAYFDLLFRQSKTLCQIGSIRTG
jgi:hypothetical protein